MIQIAFLHTPDTAHGIMVVVVPNKVKLSEQRTHNTRSESRSNTPIVPLSFCLGTYGSQS